MSDILVKAVLIVMLFFLIIKSGQNPRKGNGESYSPLFKDGRFMGHPFGYDRLL